MSYWPLALLRAIPVALTLLASLASPVQATPARSDSAGRCAGSLSDRTSKTVVSAQQIEQHARLAIAQVLQGRFEHVSIELTQKLSDVQVPQGQRRLATRTVGSDPAAPRATVWVDIEVAGVVCRSVPVMVDITLENEALVARRALTAGSLLEEADVERKLVDVTGQAGDVVRAPTMHLPARLQRSIREGAVLKRLDLAPQRGVVRGDRVRVTYQQGGVTLATSATAQRTASLGEVLLVRRDGATAPIQARVSGDQEVTVDAQ